MASAAALGAVPMKPQLAVIAILFVGAVGTLMLMMAFRLMSMAF